MLRRGRRRMLFRSIPLLEVETKGMFSERWFGQAASAALELCCLAADM